MPSSSELGGAGECVYCEYQPGAQHSLQATTGLKHREDFPGEEAVKEHLL